MADKTVILSDPEWQQLIAIIANATGYMTFQKLVQQLQAQDMPRGDVPRGDVPKGDGRDLDLPESLRRVPRA